MCLQADANVQIMSMHQIFIGEVLSHFQHTFGHLHRADRHIACKKKKTFLV